jgi:magnesium transporter
MDTISLSEVLGARVTDSSGGFSGRVREVALSPQDHPARVAALIVRTRDGDRLITSDKLADITSTRVHVNSKHEDWPVFAGPEGFLLLERDLLDQQIIDVNGKKVVRVNDIDFTLEQLNGQVTLKVSHVDVGPRGAVRRLLKGVVPRAAIHALMARLPAKVIPWDFVDLIETDPARRVKLKIEHERLSSMHPADLADILEELAPAQREAIFESLDEDVAADALEEINPKMQASLVESLDSEHAADIVEEMDPDAAADLLEKLSDETSEEILEEMEPEEREEVEELLEFEEDTAAGRMTTDFIALPPTATAQDAIDRLRNYEGGVESISSIFVVDKNGKLLGAVPLAKLAIASPQQQLSALSSGEVVSCKTGTKENQVAELFDKYNLTTLPVVDAAGRLQGIITADDVISLLRSQGEFK